MSNEQGTMCNSTKPQREVLNTYVCGAPTAARRQVLTSCAAATRCGWVFDHSRAPFRALASSARPKIANRKSQIANRSGWSREILRRFTEGTTAPRGRNVVDRPEH